jgi:hypothetical protein
MNPPTVKTIGDPGDSEWLFRLLQQISQLSQAALLSKSELLGEVLGVLDTRSHLSSK